MPLIDVNNCALLVTTFSQLHWLHLLKISIR